MRVMIFTCLVVILFSFCIIFPFLKEEGEQEQAKSNVNIMEEWGETEAAEEPEVEEPEETEVVEEVEEPEVVEEPEAVGIAGMPESETEEQTESEYPKKLSEEIMITYDDKPSFKDSAKDTFGNVYENIYCFNSRSYDFGTTSATFAVGNANQFKCVIAPHKSLKDRMTLIIQLDDIVVNEIAVEATTEPFALLLDLGNAKTVTISLGHMNGVGVAASGPSGGILVDGRFEQNN